MIKVLKNIAHNVNARLHDEQGDVPGWVLITLMTAGLVVAIWAIAAPALGTVFDQAISRVVSF
ncbi:hypothetical protein [Aurantimicrobium sp. MWH-Uga1]|uniref:hypothetical protein n=1 Tax=Aurantimicrobium sp. MWH-Uga1 TaxID=2079575 RepID=UPI000DEDDC6A|nr:hypothetical protein [Aurantimicrobium sp. MWH-Uga1]AXE54860.1 hypothetical protein AURUGA1_01183 [Aurantimicrobium sp. MWH-Uga1]